MNLHESYTILPDNVRLVFQQEEIKIGSHFLSRLTITENGSFKVLTYSEYLIYADLQRSLKCRELTKCMFFKEDVERIVNGLQSLTESHMNSWDVCHYLWPEKFDKVKPKTRAKRAKFTAR